MLDRRERSGELTEAVLVAQEGHQTRLWTCLPGIVQSFDAAKRTCSVQPAIKALMSLPDGSTQWVEMPLLVDCPVQFPGSANLSLTFPLRQGDECLVVFASRCIDAWWQSGGIQVQAELRMHSLSDGFAVPGIRSVPAVEAGGVHATEAQLRSHDGTYLLGVDRDTGHVRLKAPDSEVKCSDGRVDITGVLWVNGERYIDHRHTGVTVGGGTTGGKA